MKEQLDFCVDHTIIHDLMHLDLETALKSSKCICYSEKDFSVVPLKSGMLSQWALCWNFVYSVHVCQVKFDVAFSSLNKICINGAVNNGPFS